jgi:hypothetical protein
MPETLQFYYFNFKSNETVSYARNLMFVPLSYRATNEHCEYIIYNGEQLIFLN